MESSALDQHGHWNQRTHDSWRPARSFEWRCWWGRAGEYAGGCGAGCRCRRLGAGGRAYRFHIPEGVAFRREKRPERKHFTAVLPEFRHFNFCKRVPNRLLRGRRGRFGTLLQRLECRNFERMALWREQRERKQNENSQRKASMREGDYTLDTHPGPPLTPWTCSSRPRPG